MDRQQIHPPAVAIVVETHLDIDRPARLAEHARNLILNGGVGRIEKAIKALTAPTQRQIQRGIEGGRDRIDRSDRHVLQPAAFEPRDHVARQGAADGKVRLTPAALAAQGPDRAGEIGSHRPMVAAGRYRRLTSRQGARLPSWQPHPPGQMGVSPWPWSRRSSGSRMAVAACATAWRRPRTEARTSRCCPRFRSTPGAPPPRTSATTTPNRWVARA